MADIYIDESGGFDGKEPLLLIGAHLCFESSKLDSTIQEFENELSSNIKYQVILRDYEAQGIHACVNHPLIKDLFTSFLNRTAGRYAFAFTRKCPSDKTEKEVYVDIVAGFSRTLIMKVNNLGGGVNLFYESSEKYLRNNTDDNKLLEKAILQQNKNAKIIIEGKDKKFKKLGFVDYACNLVYKNIRRVFDGKTPEEEALTSALYEQIEQNTSFIWDMDRKKWLRPRKTPKEKRILDFWLRES